MTATAPSTAPANTVPPSSNLIIGPTGSGKSTLLATGAEYLWETHKRVLDLYSADPGGFPARVQSLVALGIIRVFRLRTRGESLAFETLSKASKGWWPSRINVRTGQCPQGVAMVPPVTTLYSRTCPNCQHTRTVLAQTLLNTPCPNCRQPIPPDVLVQTALQATKGFEQRGGVAFDSITSMSDWMLQDLSHRDEIRGEEAALGGKLYVGDEVFRGNNRSQVGFAQTRIHELVTNANSIPNLLMPPIWTAIAAETTDTGGLTLVGPKLAGNAKTDSAPQWFGNCIESALIETDEGAVRRLYLNEYIDQQGRRHLLKHRGDPRKIPAFLDDPPIKPGQEHEVAADAICSNFSLKTFFSLLDQAVASQVTEMAAKYPDAPGAPDEEQVFGAVEQLTPASTTGSRPAPGAPRAAAAPKAGRPAPPTRKPAAAPASPAAAPEASSGDAPASQPSADSPAESSAEGVSEPSATPEPAATAPSAPVPAPSTAPSPAPVATRPVAPPPGVRPSVRPPARPPSGRPAARPAPPKPQ